MGLFLGRALLSFPNLSDVPYPGSHLPLVFPFSYEDPAALDGGEEGMDVITHILALASWLLKDSGYGWSGSPWSVPSSLLPSHCVLGLPWQSFCPYPSQSGQPRNAGPSTASWS